MALSTNFLDPGRTIIATYSVSRELLKKSQSLIDLPYRRVILHNWSPKECVVNLIRLDADWVIYLDEDAFVFDSAAIKEILAFMAESDYVCCGMPDGGVIWHRFHNPVACNPFFLILNTQFIRNSPHYTEGIADEEWCPVYEKNVADFVARGNLKYLFDEAEPFYGFFFWLCKNSYRILYLEGRDWSGEEEKITTELLNHEGRPFLLHSWYSRLYDKQELSLKEIFLLFLGWLSWRIKTSPIGDHFQRINKAFVTAKAIRQKHS